MLVQVVAVQIQSVASNEREVTYIWHEIVICCELWIRIDIHVLAYIPVVYRELLNLHQMTAFCQMSRI